MEFNLQPYFFSLLLVVWLFTLGLCILMSAKLEAFKHVFIMHVAKMEQMYDWNKDKFIKKTIGNIPASVAEIRKPKKPQRIISEETRKKSSEKRREWWANKKAQEAAKAAPSAIIVPKGMSLVSQDLNA